MQGLIFRGNYWELRSHTYFAAGTQFPHLKVVKLMHCNELTKACGYV